MSAKSALNKTYKIIKKSHLAVKLGVRYQSIDNWITKNRLPDTEYSGRTNYALQIERITEGRVTVEDLLNYRPPHQVPDKD